MDKLNIDKYLFKLDSLNLNINQKRQLIRLILENGGGSGGNVEVDSKLSQTSTNPVQNKVITNTIGDLSLLDNIVKDTNLVAAINKAAKNGGIFTPHLDSAGNLSWTNNAGLPNPEPVNIKGKDGVDLGQTVLTQNIKEGAEEMKSVPSTDAVAKKLVTLEDKKGVYEVTTIDVKEYNSLPYIKLTNTDNEERLFYIQMKDVSGKNLGFLYNGTFTQKLKPNEFYEALDVALKPTTAILFIGSNTPVKVGDFKFEVTFKKSILNELQEQINDTTNEVKGITQTLTEEPYNILSKNKELLKLYSDKYKFKYVDEYNRLVASIDGDSIMGAQLEDVEQSEGWSDFTFAPNMSRKIIAYKFYQKYKFNNEDVQFVNIQNHKWVKKGFAKDNKLDGAAFNRFECFGGTEEDTAEITVTGYKFFKLIWSGKTNIDYTFDIKISVDDVPYKSPSELNIKLPDLVTNENKDTTLQKYAICILEKTKTYKIKVTIKSNGQKVCFWGAEMWNNPRLDVVVQAFSGSTSRTNYSYMKNAYYGDFHKPAIVISDILSINDNSEINQGIMTVSKWSEYNSKLYGLCKDNGIPLLLIRPHGGDESKGNFNETVRIASGLSMLPSENAFIDITKKMNILGTPLADVVNTTDHLHLSNNGITYYFEELEKLFS